MSKRPNAKVNEKKCKDGVKVALEDLLSAAQVSPNLTQKGQLQAAGALITGTRWWQFLHNATRVFGYSCIETEEGKILSAEDAWSYFLSLVNEVEPGLAQVLTGFLPCAQQFKAAFIWQLAGQLGIRYEETSLGTGEGPDGDVDELLEVAIFFHPEGIEHGGRLIQGPCFENARLDHSWRENKGLRLVSKDYQLEMPVSSNSSPIRDKRLLRRQKLIRKKKGNQLVHGTGF